ncbi:MAG: hypothetical protein JW889_10135 [Verrucomicrobia bacterium]|nr:hypothetical protein [Verrucomicrobiota bacterium]
MGILLCLVCTLMLAPALCRTAEAGERVVYVVPDVETFTYAISLWDKDIHFPIFIGEGHFLDIFLKGYPGAQVKKLGKRKVGRIDRSLIYRTLYAAWGPETLDDAPAKVEEDALKARLNGLGIVPRGVVVTNVTDAEFAGGLALAAGRHQPIVFHTSASKRSPEDKAFKHSAKEDVKEHLRIAILDGVKQWGYPYEGLGQGIDYITLALNMPHAYWFPERREKVTNVAGYSMTDAIGRLTRSGLIESGPGTGEPSVYAYCGLLIEAAPQMALYQAMAGLFAETPRALYFDRWVNIHGLEGEKGYQVLRTKVNTVNRHLRAKPTAEVSLWRRLTEGGHGFGFIHLQSVGSAYQWSSATVEDVPEGPPCVVFFAQSGSAGNPSLTDTLAGRWLLNGAYVYYGAVSEPYAPSFNAAQTVARTLVAGGTYAEAFQRKDTLPVQFRGPWKLIYIGDPLACPRFVEDPEEPEWSRAWRRAVAHLRQADYREAVLTLEQVFAQVPAARANEFWQDLLRAYELTLGIGLLNLEEPAAVFRPELIDGWMLSAELATRRPEPGWMARQHLRLTKAEDLSDLLASRLKVEGLSEGLKERLRVEIQALDAAATHARMWLVLGPVAWVDPSNALEGFPFDLMPDREKTFEGLDGPVSWTPKLVDADSFCLALAPPRRHAAGLYLATAIVEVPGSKPTGVSLRLAGMAAKTTPAPQVWVNREAVALPVDGSAALTLRAGLNEIIVRIVLQETAREPVTFGLRLTDPDGKRSRTFKYFDLIGHRDQRNAPLHAPAPRGS